MIDTVNNEKNTNDTKNITLFLGNGFDLNLGLKTSYEDFLDKYLNNTNNDNANIKKMKDLLSKNQKNWCDLEFEIGQLTSKFNNHTEFYEALCDIGKGLIVYLTEQEYRFDKKTENEKELIARKFLGDILRFLNTNSVYDPGNINILTFNYTTIIDKLISLIISLISNDIQLKEKFKQLDISFNEVIHCHGRINEKICFGVNDKSQIGNLKIFDNNKRYLEQLIKPLRNSTIYTNNVSIIKKMIFDSDLILNYGCSFGKTDNYWLDLLSGWLGILTSRDSFGHFEHKYFGNETLANKKLYVYSFYKKPESLFDADSLEFEDDIREKYSLRNDNRINIEYNNIFEDIMNVI